MSRLDLVVGPNGAGKSTFVRLILAPILPASVFVNADVIAGQRVNGHVEVSGFGQLKVSGLHGGSGLGLGASVPAPGLAHAV